MVDPIIPGKQQNPSQVTGTQSHGGKQGFDRGLQQRSEGYTEQELKKAVRDRTRITRSKPIDKVEKKSLYLVPKIESNNETLNEPVYRTVMVDGIMHTIKLLCVA